MKKIKITRKQYKRLSFLYRIGGFILIVGLLISYSILIGRPTEFVLIFIPYFITKGFYEKQFHSKSLKQCFVLSLLIFAFLTTISLPKEISISASCVVGVSVAYLSCRVGIIRDEIERLKKVEKEYNDIIQVKEFDVTNCTEIELLERCRRLHFSEINTNLAIEFFIKQTPHKIIADRLNINEKSVTMKKTRMKDKLNGENKFIKTVVKCTQT